jgi:hypothetical protein
VVSNPWFAVTGEDGEFLIEGIPPGERTLAIWHERFQEPIHRRVLVEGATPASVEILLPPPR